MGYGRQAIRKFKDVALYSMEGMKMMKLRG